ncbi:glycosyltransferase [Methylomonas rapida]|uniref:Glycosyltransferase n=1 Tax=Methylomonas rapida TaxID=2963939 RepID=A0ABY7GLF2_9GAMM|nr:glycosyltransferase [Methylomonas rapida]WAR45341.1 glycosyltransferase [Methylomonas rapida]
MDINNAGKIGFLSASISRNSGGLYDAMRNLAIGLNSSHTFNVNVIGLNDIFTQEDMRGWGAVSVHNLNKIGPSSFGFAPKLIEFLLKSEIDILHSHGLWMYTSIASLKWAESSNKPYIISPHGMLDPWALKNSNLKKRLASFFYEAKHLKNASCIHALCEEEANSIREYGLRNPICIIPNGINTQNNKINSIPQWRRNIGYDKRILLFLGRLHPKKGVSELLDALVLTRDSNKLDNWNLVIAGWDQLSHEDFLKDKVKKLGLTEFVHFIGPQFNEDKAECYLCADAYILPSFSEGLPMTVLEAWSYGLPVIMTPQCNLPSGFNKNAAISVNPNAFSIKDGLINLFGMHNSELRSMGENGNLLVKSHFSWEFISNQMTDVYNWLLGNNSKPDCVHLK